MKWHLGGFMKHSSSKSTHIIPPPKQSVECNSDMLRYLISPLANNCIFLSSGLLQIAINLPKFGIAQYSWPWTYHINQPVIMSHNYLPKAWTFLLLVAHHWNSLKRVFGWILLRHPWGSPTHKKWCGMSGSISPSYHNVNGRVFQWNRGILDFDGKFFFQTICVMEIRKSTVRTVPPEIRVNKKPEIFLGPWWWWIIE